MQGTDENGRLAHFAKFLRRLLERKGLRGVGGPFGSKKQTGSADGLEEGVTRVEERRLVTLG